MSPALDLLEEFRAVLYGCFRYRADALFELTDALLTMGPTPSPAHLSLAPVHRRGWGSLYAALAHGRIARTAVQDLVARYPWPMASPSTRSSPCSPTARESPDDLA